MGTSFTSSGAALLRCRIQFVGMAHVANLQITTTQLTDIFDTIQAAATKNNLPSWRNG